MYRLGKSGIEVWIALFCVDELQTPEGISEEQRIQELAAMEETRIGILNNLEELEQKIKDINDQMDESSREV